VANKRNKSRKQQRSRRSGVPLSPTTSPSPPAGAPAATVSAETAAPRQQPPAPTSRYASAVSGPRRGGTTAATVGTIDIDERVPYFGKDLRRIVITAAVMVVIIVGASFLLH
jgi:hypothetical protein